MTYISKEKELRKTIEKGDVHANYLKRHYNEKNHFYVSQNRMWFLIDYDLQEHEQLQAIYNLLTTCSDNWESTATPLLAIESILEDLIKQNYGKKIHKKRRRKNGNRAPRKKI